MVINTWLTPFFAKWIGGKGSELGFEGGHSNMLKVSRIFHIFCYPNTDPVNKPRIMTFELFGRVTPDWER